MRQEFSKALRTSFERAMKEQLPEYMLAKVKSVYFMPSHTHAVVLADAGEKAGGMAGTNSSFGETFVRLTVS